MVREGARPVCGSTHSPHPALGAVRLSQESAADISTQVTGRLTGLFHQYLLMEIKGRGRGGRRGLGPRGSDRKTAPVTLSAGSINLSGKRSWLCSEVCPQNVKSATHIPQRLFKDCWVYLASFCSTAVWQKNEIATILFSVSCFYDESSTYPRTETRQDLDGFVPSDLFSCLFV